MSTDLDDSIEKPGFSEKPPALGNITIKHRTSIGDTRGCYGADHLAAATPRLRCSGSKKRDISYPSSKSVPFDYMPTSARGIFNWIKAD
jgi:hypothetical protein